MTMSRLHHIAIRATILGALVAGTAGAAIAQQVKPPVVTKGSVKSNPKADKGQATAEAARASARDRKATKDAFKAARLEPKSLLRGIKFTSMEKRMNRDITKRYAREYKALEKANKVAVKAGTPDAAIMTKIDVLRVQERAELRAVLTPEQRVRFDANSTALDSQRA